MYGRKLLRSCIAAVALLVLAGCGVGYPWPSVGSTSGHRDIIVFGDSITANTLALLPSVVAARGFNATFIDEHINGSGLLSPMDGMDSVAYVTAKLDAHPEADIALFQWIGNCLRPCAYPYGSSQFLTAWQDKMQAIIDVTRARGVKVVWAVSPPPLPVERAVNHAPDYPDFVSQSMALIVAEMRLATQPGVTVTNWYTPLAADDGFLGRYDNVLLYDGQLHAVRLDDAVHLSVDGAIRTSVWTAATLASIW
jgi:hypothetical protein